MKAVNTLIVLVFSLTLLAGCDSLVGTTQAPEDDAAMMEEDAAMMEEDAAMMEEDAAMME